MRQTIKKPLRPLPVAPAQPGAYRACWASRKDVMGTILRWCDVGLPLGRRIKTSDIDDAAQAIGDIDQPARNHPRPNGAR
jgi:hypothetical protein